MTWLLVALSLIAALDTAGCKSRERDETPEQTEPPPAEATPSEGVRGVPAEAGDLPLECHEYVAALELLARCSELSRQARDGIRQAGPDALAGWARLPPEDRAALANTCKSATAAVRKSAAGCKTDNTIPGIEKLSSNDAFPDGLPATCREYAAAIAAFVKCTKAPQAARDALREAYENISASWAGMPAEGMAYLETSCRAAADAAKQAAAACN